MPDVRLGYHSMPRTNLKRRDALPAGTILRDFTIQAVIGHGGFGIVYRAGHNELDPDGRDQGIPAGRTGRARRRDGAAP